jgi:Zn-dependent M28 family amino/carboxypeptidase
MRVRQRVESDTRALALPRGRRVGQPGHAVAREYLVGRLDAIGAEPFRSGDFVNVIGRIPGTGDRERPILIGAHYDSVIDDPCADDNATACAVGLAAAEAFVQRPLERDVIIAFFDAEEPPFFITPAMGSIRFYEDQRDELDFAGVIIMDLIGHDVESPLPGSGLEELLFVMGAESHPALPSIVEGASGQVNDLRVVGTLNRYVGDMSDHHAFRVGGHPYLFLSCGQGRCYHQPCDTPEWVNFDKVVRVYEFVMALARGIDADEVSAHAPLVPTEAYEIRTLRRAFGPLLDGVLAMAEMPSLKTRADLDRLVPFLAGSLDV